MFLKTRGIMFSSFSSMKHFTIENMKIKNLVKDKSMLLIDEAQYLKNSKTKKMVGLFNFSTVVKFKMFNSGTFYLEKIEN